MTTNGGKTAVKVKDAEPFETAAVIHLKRLERAVVEIEIEGLTPLIMHNWSAKSKRQMLGTQQGELKEKKAPKDPVAEYEAAFYRLDDGRPGMPAVAFKSATAQAARFYDGLTMKSMQAAVFVHGIGVDQLVPIAGEVSMREDTPRNSNGNPDLRYRPQFWPWSAVLVVEYLPTMLSAESVFNLVDAGGRNGVGDWRPSAPKSYTGTYGQFKVTA